MLDLFQFHKGTIRTVRFADSLTSLLYFNSIKVRLELFTEQDTTLCILISIP